MFKEYITQYLNDLSLPEEQKQQVWTLLSNIKDNEALLAEFFHQKKSSLISDSTASESTASNQPRIHEETFFGMDFDLTEAANEAADNKKQEQASLEMIDQDSDEHAINETLDIFLGIDDDDTEILERTIAALEQENNEAIQPPLTSSQNMEDRYIDLGLLGKGGMGEVRKVRDKVLKRNLAMKIIHLNFVQNKNALSRFIEEAQVGAQLQHPNIVPIHDLGELPDGRFYFTMKQIRGREFTDLIQEVHQASTEEMWRASPNGTTFRRLIQIFHTICETMAFSHSLGVIHRDLKPENVMIGDFGEVLVVDWGIAKVLGAAETFIEDFDDLVQTDHAMATRMGMVAGTPSYMSPEQAKGRIDLVSTPSDIYTLGAILYEILSGKPPYTGASALEIVEQVKEKRPVSLLLTAFEGAAIEDIPSVEALDEAAGKIPLPLIDICEKAMKREIKDRYPSAAELAQDISDWLEGAQKRDKAFKEYELGLEKIEQAEKLKKRYEHYWKEANHSIQESGFASNEGWQLWRKAMEARQEALQLRMDYRKSLQDALVYDFSLEEANEASARLLIDDIITALANGDRSQRSFFEKQFTSYLQHLSTKKQDELRGELLRKRSDNITLARARKGGLIGRSAIKQEIKIALQQSRLISLIGTAGVGKTRLALEIIYELPEAATQRYFCDLTEAKTEIDVARFVAKEMELQLRSIDPIGQIGELFATQKTILVLDKLEQALEPVKNIIQIWMKQAPSLQIIATSRVKLRLESEHPFSIQPLSILEGMELFTKRGQKTNGAFSLNEQTRQIVGRLVNQLDYLPLAIELAAARLSLFSVEDIEQRLKERFSLLRSREKGTQALQGALDWSWDLLKPWAKAALSQASIFRGGFALTGAENVFVTGDWKGSAPAIFDILQDLCDDSLLLQTKSEDGKIRYGLLESIRQYSQEKLKDKESIAHNLSGKEAHRQTALRHAKHYSQFGEKAFLDSLDSQDDKTIWHSFSDELDNFIAGTQNGEGTTTLYCCLAALKILGMRGPVSLGIDIAAEVIGLPSLSHQEKKQLRIIRSRFLRISGRMKEARETQDSSEQDSLLTQETSLEQLSREEIEALRLEAEASWENGNLEEAESSYEKALQYYQTSHKIYSLLKDIKGAILVHQKIGQVFNNQGNFDRALREFNDALVLAEKHEFFLLKAEIYSSMGRICRQKSDYKGALALFEKALQTCQKLGDRFGEADNLGKLGILYSDLGDYESSIAQYKLSLEIAREIGNKRQEGTSLGNLGVVYRNIGDYENAISAFTQAKDLAINIGNKIIEGAHLGNIGCVYTDIKEFEKAVQHHEEAIDIFREIGDKTNEGINLGNLGSNLICLERWNDAETILTQAIDICTQTLPPAAGAFSAPLAWAKAQSNHLEEAIQVLEKGEPMVAVYPLEHGKFLCGKAKVFMLAAQPEKTKEALEQAKTIAVKLNATEDSILPKTIKETEAYLSEMRK